MKPFNTDICLWQNERVIAKERNTHLAALNGEVWRISGPDHRMIGQFPDQISATNTLINTGWRQYGMFFHP